ncbi:MAG: helix-turn-helix domain-containing protein, partial [Blastocatellia bacterium]
STWLGGQADAMLDGGLDLHAEVQRYERSLISAALERCGGVQTRAAELLGLKISTLNSKLSAHGIDARTFKVRGRRVR